MDGFLAKFDPAGRPLFATYVGGGPFGAEMDPEGRVFVAAITKSPDSEVTPDAVVRADAMLRIYSPTGVHSTVFGGRRRDTVAMWASMKRPSGRRAPDAISRLPNARRSLR